MLLLSGHYAPCILTGTQNWTWQWPQQGPARKFSWQRGIYELVAVWEGMHHVELEGVSHRFGEGAMYLLQPQHQYLIQGGRGSLARTLRFTVMATSLRFLNPGRSQAMILEDPEHRQPEPSAIWGIDMPLHIPNQLADMLHNELRYLCDLWWRNGHSHHSANVRLARLLEVMFKHQNPADGYKGKELDCPILTALRYAHTNISSIRRVEDLAAVAGYSRSHFSREFVRIVGERADVFLRRIRLERAMDLLRTTDRTIAGVAHMVGYRNTAALAHAFQSALQTTPRAWRSNWRHPHLD